LKIIILILSFILLLPVICRAQIKFQLAIGGAGTDYAYSIKATSDGGYAAAGGTNSFGGENFYIIKLSSSGLLQWSRSIGGPNYEGAFFIVQTSDGGYAAAGGTASFGAGNNDFYIVKLDSAGNMQWNKTVGGIYEDVAFAIIQSTDGGYAIAGYTYSFGAGDRDFYIVKLDASGNLQWNRTIGGMYYEYGETLIQTSDGGYAVAGFTYSFGAGNGDFYIVKLDSGGSLLWSKTIGGTQPDYCLSIIQTTDGGYAAAGPSSSYGGGDNDFYIVKLDGSGSFQWTRTFGGSGLDYAESVIQTTDGGYAVAGLTYSFGAGNKDMYIVRLDSSGNLLWNRAIGGPNYDYAESIVQTSDGGYIAAGHTNSYGAGDYDAYIVKLDAGGNTCGNSITPSPVTSSGGISGNPSTIITTPSPLVTSPSATTGTGGTLTTICLTAIQPVSQEIPNIFSLSQNYPNPFNPSAKIKFSIPMDSRLRGNDNVVLRIFDGLGREVQMLINEPLQPGNYEVEWDGANYPSGVYYYRLIAGDYSETKKMVLVK
jgi:beta-propeller uncharacterized protein DUF5122